MATPREHTLTVTWKKQHNSCCIHELNFIDTLITYIVQHAVQSDCNRTVPTCTKSLLSACSATRMRVKVLAAGGTKYTCHSVMSVSEKNMDSCLYLSMSLYSVNCLLWQELSRTLCATSCLWLWIIVKTSYLKQYRNTVRVFYKKWLFVQLISGNTQQSAPCNSR